MNIVFLFVSLWLTLTGTAQADSPVTNNTTNDQQQILDEQTQPTTYDPNREIDEETKAMYNSLEVREGVLGVYDPALEDPIPQVPARAIFTMIALSFFFLLFYLYFSLSIETIAQKTNTSQRWLAWIPILNCLLVVMIIRKPLWWFILLLLPLVNIVFCVLVWMKIAEIMKKPSWLGILILVPIANIILPGYLAWNNDDYTSTTNTGF